MRFRGRISEQVNTEERKPRKTDWATVQDSNARFGCFPTVTARYGLSRSVLYEKIASGDIKSTVVKNKGARCGIRLIDLRSVEQFIRRNMVKVAAKQRVRMPNELKFHPAADWLPSLNGTEFQELKADIASRGLREAILVKSGHIIDGRHRYRACRELGIEPRFEEYDGTDIIAEILSRNILRRHLTPQQRAELVVKMCGDQLSADAQDRIKAHQFGASKSTAGLKSAQPETRGRTAERIAKIARVGRDMAREALRAHKRQTSETKSEKIEASENA
jgi:hypothetical protein